MKILELFSGYGTASFALKRLGIDYEIVGYSDIDKYANQCFKQNHGGKELGDVKTINPYDLEDFDLLTGGFPCQSFSVAGKGLGEADPRGTLFYEIIRIAEVKKPKYMLLENVKGLTNKPHKQTFDKILSELDRIGYNVYWKVLNSKDYGIPQSRARVWFVCFRKDIEHKFEWPQPTELKIFIKDILEDEVDKKYYLSEKLQERFAKYLNDKNIIINPYNKCQSETTSGTIGTSVGGSTSKTAQVVKVENRVVNLQHENSKEIVAMRSYPRTGTKSQYDTNMSIPEIGEAHRIYGVNGISPPIKQSGINIKDNLVYDLHRKNEIREYENISNTLSQVMGTGGNNVPSVAISNSSPRECGFQEEISPTLLSRDYKDPKIVINDYILRKLTPKECFRLMGFLNDEINLDGLSDTQKYKLAGNGQDVNMVSLIFKQMFKGE